MSDYRHTLPGDYSAKVWVRGTPNALANQGFGTCNTDSGERRICCLGGIGCDIDHVLQKRRENGPELPRRSFSLEEIDEILRALAERISCRISRQ